MKKKTFGRFTALGIAALTAVPAFIIPASAASSFTQSGTNAFGTVYYAKTAGAGNTIFYSSTAAGIADSAGTVAGDFSSGDLYSLRGTATYVAVTQIPAGGYKIELTTVSTGGNLKIVADSANNNNTDNLTGKIYYPSAANRYAETSGKVYYVGGYYYPSYAAALAAASQGNYSVSNITPYTPSQGWTSTYTYFSYKTGEFYSSSTIIGSAGSNDYYTVTAKGTSSSTYTYTVTRYKSSATGKYYLTAAEASAAGGTVTTSTTNSNGYAWYNLSTGLFYSTEGYAKEASNNSADVIYAPNYGYYNSSAYYDNYYYYGSYYNDPYYQYFYNKNNSTSTSTSTSTATTTAVSTEPVISGTKIVGWTSIVNNMSTYANKTLSIKMNESTQVTKSVLAAAKKNNVTLSLTLPNGVIWTIKGSDVATAKTISLDTTYNTQNIPTSLVSKAKKGAVASAQFTIGQNTTLGCDADVTVKFSKSRAGKSVKLYRYNSAKNTLVLVDTAKITSTGAATFTVAQGGDFIAVIG